MRREIAERNRKRRAVAVRTGMSAALLLLMVIGIGNSKTVDTLLQANLPVLPTEWLSFATIAVLALVSVAAMVYMLSGLIGSEEAKNWSRNQIYEGLLSLVILMILIAFIWIFSQNVWQTYYAAGLTAQPTSIYSCQSAQDLFEIATCNLAQFNGLAMGFFQSVYFFGVIAGLAPGISYSYDTSYFNTQIVVTYGIPAILPVTIEDIMGNVYSILILLYILNQVQLLLLAGSALWLSFFVTLGVVARALGFSRSFGGAMIAIGLGLGLILPLMTSITYGYLDFQLSTVQTLTPAGITSYLLEYGIPLAVEYFTSLGAFAPQLPGGPTLFQIVLLGGGMTFLPFINFTVVDAFIVDLSSAIGERVNFMTLLTGAI